MSISDCSFLLLSSFFGYEHLSLLYISNYISYPRMNSPRNEQGSWTKSKTGFERVDRAKKKEKKTGYELSHPNPLESLFI